MIGIDGRVCSCWSVFMFFFLFDLSAKPDTWRVAWVIFFWEKFCISQGSGKYMVGSRTRRVLILLVFNSLYIIRIYFTFSMRFNYVEIILPSARRCHCSIYSSFSIIIVTNGVRLVVIATFCCIVKHCVF